MNGKKKFTMAIEIHCCTLKDGAGETATQFTSCLMPWNLDYLDDVRQKATGLIPIDCRKSKFSFAHLVFSWDGRYIDEHNMF